MTVGEFRRLALLAPGSRFRFHAPQWSIRWDGTVVRLDNMPDGVLCVVVIMDPIGPERLGVETPWQPGLMVEVLRDGPAR